MKYFKTKIVFYKNPVENTGHYDLMYCNHVLYKEVAANPISTDYIIFEDMTPIVAADKHDLNCAV